MILIVAYHWFHTNKQYMNGMSMRASSASSKLGKVVSDLGHMGRVHKNFILHKSGQLLQAVLLES